MEGRREWLRMPGADAAEAEWNEFAALHGAGVGCELAELVLERAAGGAEVVRTESGGGVTDVWCQYVRTACVAGTRR